MEGYKVNETVENTVKMLEDIVSACVAAENRVDNIGKELNMARDNYAQALEKLRHLETCRYHICKALKEMGVILPGTLTGWQSKYC